MITLLKLLSKLPFSVLHPVADFIYYILYFGIRYRRKDVRENLNRSFPEKSLDQIIQIEKKFYRNFSDLIVETVKNFSISKPELLARCKYMTPGLEQDWFKRGVNLMGISSHLGNWECIVLALGHQFPQICYGIYKPLSNKKLDAYVLKSRESFGVRITPIKKVREVLDQPHPRPYLIGLLSDQAPHDYSRAFEVQFLNQKTYVVPGPGILTVKYGMTPIWGWMTRTGRSQFEWGVEEIKIEPSQLAFGLEDEKQIARMAEKHEITLEQSAYALAVVTEYSKRLEKRIREAPEDWLWSHRRWKAR